MGVNKTARENVEKTYPPCSRSRGKKDKRSTFFLKDEQIPSSFSRAQQKEELVAILFHGEEHFSSHLTKVASRTGLTLIFLPNFNFL